MLTKNAFDKKKRNKAHSSFNCDSFFSDHFDSVSWSYVQMIYTNENKNINNTKQKRHDTTQNGILFIRTLRLRRWWAFSFASSSLLRVFLFSFFYFDRIHCYVSSEWKRRLTTKRSTANGSMFVYLVFHYFWHKI